MYTKIQTLINEASALLPAESLVTLDKINHKTLQEAIALEELRQETIALRQVIQGQDEIVVKRKFKVLCQTRAQYNQGTFLSYSAQPDGPCNQLYWDIAKLLFEPKTLAAMFSILFPKITHTVEVDTILKDIVTPYLPSSTPLKKRIHIVIKEQDLATALTETLNSPHVLTQYVMSTTHLLKVEQVANLPFYLQQQLFQALKPYPHLAQRLYQHNGEFKQLKHDLDKVENNLTPKEALRHFIVELKLAGKNYRGADDSADNRAYTACAQFIHYLDSLDETLKNQLYSLASTPTSTSPARTLKQMLEALNEYSRSCVEIAALYLESLSENSDNQTILNISSTTSAQQRASIIKRYKHHTLSTVATSFNLYFPQLMAQIVIQRQNIHSLEDYLNLLLDLPPSEYELIFSNINILLKPALPNTLQNIIKSLNLEQKNAFSRCLFKHPDKFGGMIAVLIAVLKFSLDTKVEKIEDFIKEIPKQQVLTKQGDYENTAIHYAASCKNPDIIKTMLEHLSGNQRLKALTIQNKSGSIPIHFVVRNNNPNIIKTMLEYLSENQRLKALTIQNEKRGETPIHCAAVFSNKSDIIKTMLEYLPESQRLKALTIQNKKRGETPIHYAAAFSNKSDIIKTMLEYLPENQRLKALTIQNKKGNIPIHHAALNKNPDIIKTMLGYLPGNQRLDALTIQNKNGDTPIYLVVRDRSNPDIIKTMLEYLPENQRLKALTIQNGCGDTLIVFLVIKHGLKAVKVVLECLPENQRLAALAIKGSTTPIHFVARYHSLETIKAVLECVPEEQRLEALIIKDEDGNTCIRSLVIKHGLKAVKAIIEDLPENQPLDIVTIKNIFSIFAYSSNSIRNLPEIIKIMLKHLPESQRLEVLTMQYSGKPIIHEIARGRDPIILKTILESLPEHQRLAALTVKDTRGRTPINFLIINLAPETIKEILELLEKHPVPEEFDQLYYSLYKTSFPLTVLKNILFGQYFADKATLSLSENHFLYKQKSNKNSAENKVYTPADKKRQQRVPRAMRLGWFMGLITAMTALTFLTLLTTGVITATLFAPFSTIGIAVTGMSGMSPAFSAILSLAIVVLTPPLFMTLSYALGHLYHTIRVSFEQGDVSNFSKTEESLDNFTRPQDTKNTQPSECEVEASAASYSSGNNSSILSFPTSSTLGTSSPPRRVSRENSEENSSNTVGKNL